MISGLILASATAAPNALMVIPFVVMLFSIALMPFILKEHWHRVYPLFVIVLGGISLVYYFLVLKNPGRVLYIAHEYASFIALVGSLFVVSGGIHITVKGEAKPSVNSLFLFLGAVSANIIGTTGASMLLIRPWIRMNRYRITQFHIVFFIFIVSNIGGCLTPIGDPPLFLGYLKGVPFWWVLEHCWEAWLIGLFVLIGIFYFLDRRNFLSAPRHIREGATEHETWKFGGLHNIAFLILILVAIFIQHPVGLREALMVIAAVGSYFTTSKKVHESNRFNFEPLRELVWLFAGIFSTMIPALDLLEKHGSKLGLHTEMHFFWGTGLLSGVLDNAPTYLAFLASAFGLEGLNFNNKADMHTFIAQHGHYLIAISIGAVFFGAMTYIGNGPNFMVKSIAQSEKIRTPSFFGYIFKYAIPFLIPLFIIVSILFFSRWRIF